MNLAKLNDFNCTGFIEPVSVKPFNHLKYDFLKTFKNNKFCNVSLCSHKTKSNLYVIKRLNEMENSQSEILNEITIGKRLNHENFAKTYKFYYDKIAGYHLVIEYVEGQLLETYINENEKKIKPHEFKKIVTQMFHAILYSLDQNICPGDLNSKNIIIGKDLKVTFFDYGHYTDTSQAYSNEYIWLCTHLLNRIQKLFEITDQLSEKKYISWQAIFLSTIANTKEKCIKVFEKMLDSPFLNEIQDD